MGSILGVEFSQVYAVRKRQNRVVLPALLSNPDARLNSIGSGALESPEQTWLNLSGSRSTVRRFLFGLAV